MAGCEKSPQWGRWARFRFSVVGPLLAAPPGAGELRAALEELAKKIWIHPVTGQEVRFSFSTIERWYYLARNAEQDPVTALLRKVRRDSGVRRAIGEQLSSVILAQYRDHKGWSYQLHYDNLLARVEQDGRLGPLPSYSTVLRFMKAHGLFKQRRLTSRKTPAARHARARLEQYEVRSFEVQYVNALWHYDFHCGSRKVLTAAGAWESPVLLGVLDDCSRLCCHAQWYLQETAETLVHGLSQAYQKRALPRSDISDRGPAMEAAEVEQGLERLGILHRPTLAYSPYQNGKQEVFWAQVEGRLLAMLEGVQELPLALLNQATCAWLELEYNRKIHSEIGQSPLARYLAGPDLGRPCPSSDALRLAFCLEQSRSQRRSDGTISIEGRRFEIPSQYNHLQRVSVRYARWDLSRVWLVEPRSGTVLCRIWPLDKAANADRRRRKRHPGPLGAVQGPEGGGNAPGIAPLLRKLMAQYAASGLPPAYIAKPQTHREESP